MAEARRRRKSLSIFGHSPSPLTVITKNESSRKTYPSSAIPMADGNSTKPKTRPISMLSGRTSHNSSSPILDGNGSFERSESPKLRPRVLQKGSRSSVFGSLRSLRSLDDDERLTDTKSKASSFEDEELAGPTLLKGIFGEQVLHYGEVQTGNTMFRKKNQYLVLTESHLLKFKSQARAAEVFPSIPASLGRSSTSRQSLASIGSLKDMEAALLNDIVTGVALNQIIAVSKLDDGRPYFSIEVSHLDDRSGHNSTIHMQLSDPREADLWLSAIRRAANRAKDRDEQMFPASVLQHLAHTLEAEHDYDPDHFRVFKVVRRASSKAGGRSSMDDLSKLSSIICYLAIGMNRIHLIPPLHTSTRTSTSSLNELDASASFGLLSLTSFSMKNGDDAFQMVFRIPLRGSYAVHLASSMVQNIALWIRHRAEFLRPAWTQLPFTFNVPEAVEAQELPLPNLDEEHHCFERTLIAHCSAYDVDPSRIRYSIDYDCEDAPCFRLLSAAGSNQHYKPLELIALLRSLRYNETFGSLSFYGINLDGLQYLYDPYGVDSDAVTTRQGTAVTIDGHENLPILAQELRALALKSRRLRRFDFSFALTRVPDAGNITRSSACGIPEAILPLLKRSLTNVDWLILNGIKLGESDVDYLVDAASERTCHLRALEVSNCGLSVHDLDVLLSTLAVQESTMEIIDISGVQGRISPEIFQKQIGYFAHIRRINLTRVQKTSGPEPLIAPETLMSWRLEELILSQTLVGSQTVESVATYLASPQSETLRELHMDQCGLTGQDLAVILQFVQRPNSVRRPMHISASENRLHIGYSSLFTAIANNKTPSHLTMRMIEFEKERHFRELVNALKKNTMLVSLDISKASLPYDASPETCDALQECFAGNMTLQELDISGDHSHLDAARFGIGLNHALTGLKSNSSLTILRIEYQNLGLQGANTLADLLEHNVTLREVHCANNDITLQCFTILLNGLQKNRFLLYLPALERDRELSIEKVKREIQLMNRSNDNVSHPPPNPLRRTLTLVGAKPSRPSPEKKNAGIKPGSQADQDVITAVTELNRQWDTETLRLHRYLMRNHYIAAGEPFDENELDVQANNRGMIGIIPSTPSLQDLISEVKIGEETTTPEDDDEGLTMGYMEMNEKVGLDRTVQVE